MTQSIPLIDKRDNFEIIRDKIASILAVETAAQQVLATAGGKDPFDYTFRVYQERINPWEAFRDGDGDLTPIVNVWYDSSVYDKAASNVMTRQKTDPSRYHVDIYTFGASEDTAVGHTPGDQVAAFAAHNAIKLVRNILMHDKYKYLELQGVVWRRWIDEITAFQPQSGGQTLARIMAVRIVLAVEHNETIELEDHETLEIIDIDMKHEPGGQVIAELEYDFSAP